MRTFPDLTSADIILAEEAPMPGKIFSIDYDALKAAFPRTSSEDHGDYDFWAINFLTGSPSSGLNYVLLTSISNSLNKLFARLKDENNPQQQASLAEKITILEIRRSRLEGMFRNCTYDYGMFTGEEWKPNPQGNAPSAVVGWDPAMLQNLG